MNVDDLLGKPVLDVSTATTAGRIDDLVVDVGGRTVRGLVVGKSANGGAWLEWSDIKSMGADAVTIERVDVVTAPPGDVGPGCRQAKVLGGRVLTDEGRELGPLATIDIDPDSGAVEALVLADRRVAADQLIGIGSYATVIHDPDA